MSKHQRFGALRLLVVFALVFAVSTAHAADEPWLEPSWGSAPEPLDVEPADPWANDSSGGPLWVSVQGSLVFRDKGHKDFGAMLLLGVPLERLGKAPKRPRGTRRGVSEEAPRRHGRAEETPKPTTEPGLSEPNEAPDAEQARKKATVDRADADSQPQPLVLLSPEMAREAVRAALKEACLLSPFERLDAVATRARVSALLPELRLRVTRQLDQSQALSPTEYDPTRVTASGGSSLWLEARATFRLDRLVFADEEVPLEKHRDERAESRKKLVDRVLGDLFAWQRAMAVRDDSSKEPEERVRAAIEVVEAEASLDVLTGGWLSRWKARALRRKAP